MENKTIKEEIVNEVDDFTKALLDRDKGVWTKEQVEAMKQSLTNSPQAFQALRYNQGKVEWSLVDYKSLEPMVRVLEYGVKKYARNNWKKGMPATQIIESMLRHTYKLLEGELVDPESGVEHVGHIQCNAMFLAYVLNEKPEFNDLEKS
jgi:hypothetical protein